MVSQKLSQSAINHSNTCSHSSACCNAEIPVREKLKESSKPHAIFPVPPKEVNKEVNGENVSSPATRQTEIKRRQSKTLTSSDSARAFSGIRLSQLASTAPSPNSIEGVSVMTGIGNGCIFTTKNKSGKTIWQVEVTVGYAPNGKRIRTRRTAQSLAAAKKLHRKLLAELYAGDLKTKSAETLMDYSLWWVRNVKSLQVRQSTLSDYEDRLRRCVFPHFGNRRLEDIQCRDIQNWLSLLRSSGSATATINGARQVLGAVFSHAVKSGVLVKNQVLLTDRIRRLSDEKTQLQEPWSLEEAKNVLQQATGSPYDLFLRLALLLGARRGEILGLRWKDIDFAKGFLQINVSLREVRTIRDDGSGKTALVIGETKTRNSRRKLAIGTEVLLAFQRHRDLVAATKAAAGNRWADTDQVFVNSIGGLAHPGNFSRGFKQFLQQADCRVIRIHDMRHTAAVLSLASGVRLEAVSQGLGHSRIDITKNVYAPYVQPLITEFSIGLSNYLAPNQQVQVVSPSQILEAAK